MRIPFMQMYAITCCLITGDATPLLHLELPTLLLTRLPNAPASIRITRQDQLLGCKNGLDFAM